MEVSTMHKNLILKEEAGKAAKKAKTEVKKIPGTKEKSGSGPLYAPGSWKGTKSNPKIENISYKQRYIPGLWKENKPKYVPGFWKGTKENPKIEKIKYKQRYIPGLWKGTSQTKRTEKISYSQKYRPGFWKGTKGNPKISEIKYKQRYIPGLWKESKPKYRPGFWKGTKENPKI
jgi:hypothetical protein